MLPIILTMSDTDDRAFVEKLYHRYRKKIYASALRILSCREDAEDCVHDVIKTVITHVDTFRAADAAGLSKLLALCTRNAALDIYRKNKKRQDHESKLPFDTEHENELLGEMNALTAQNPSPDAVILSEENKRRLAQIISSLDDIYKDVLILKYRHHMKNRDIADILKISENAVGVRLYRAKKILLQERGTELNEIRKNGSV